jgi:hypothetical protein
MEFSRVSKDFDFISVINNETELYPAQFYVHHLNYQ